MSDILADRFLAVSDLTDDSDWNDVRRRARRGDRRRPVALLTSRELLSERLRAQEVHFLDEIRVQAEPRRRLPRLVPRRTRSLVAAAILVAAVAAAPALAFSTTVRDLVGLKTSSPRGPVFVARVTGVFLHGPSRPGTLVTVTFTVGEQGNPPGTGIPQGSTFLVLVVPKTRRAGHLTEAYGKHGHYRATIRLGPGGIGRIQIGGFMPSNGRKALNGGFWIPTIIVKRPR